jgi:hypothetical protein
MKGVLLIFLFVCLPTNPAAAEKQGEKSREPLVTYELYSWQGDSGTWNFALLPTTSRLKTPDEIFGEKEAIRGVDKLKQRIARLDRRSRIIWIETIVYKGVPMKGTERLAWPPKSVIEEVREYSAARHVEVVGSPDFS